MAIRLADVMELVQQAYGICYTVERKRKPYRTVWVLGGLVIGGALKSTTVEIAEADTLAQLAMMIRKNWNNPLWGRFGDHVRKRTQASLPGNAQLRNGQNNS